MVWLLVAHLLISRLMSLPRPDLCKHVIPELALPRVGILRTGSGIVEHCLPPASAQLKDFLPALVDRLLGHSARLATRQRDSRLAGSWERGVHQVAGATGVKPAIVTLTDRDPAVSL